MLICVKRGALSADTVHLAKYCGGLYVPAVCGEEVDEPPPAKHKRGELPPPRGWGE